MLMAKTLKYRLYTMRNENHFVSYESVICSILGDFHDTFNFPLDAFHDFEEVFNLESDFDENNYSLFLQELKTDFSNVAREIDEFDLLYKATTKDSDLRFYLDSKLDLTSQKLGELSNERQTDTEFLHKYTTNISQLAEKNKVKIIAREKELHLLKIFLSTLLKRNVLLVGLPGVGKTSLVEALAEDINKGFVSKTMKNCDIIRLDINKIISNTKYRGEFEERFTRLLEISAKRKCILFLDEIHIYINAGNSEGGISSADMLKPYLLNPDLRFIGATTIDEFSLLFYRLVWT